MSTSEYANVSGNIVSVLQLGCLFGALAIGPITQRYGRRPAFLITTTVFLIGSLMQVVAGTNGSRSLGPIYAGRFIGGAGVGSTSMLVPIYISECAPKRIRGRCVGMMQLFNVTGISISYWTNYGVIRTIPTGPEQWRIPFGVQMIPGGMLFIGMLFLKESPRWLAEHDQVEKATKSLAWMRSSSVGDPIITAEMDQIVESIEREKSIAKPGTMQSIREIMASKSLRMRLFIGLVLQMAQQFSGTNAINYYSPSIFKSVGLSSTESDLLATGVYGVVKIVVTAIGLMIAIDQFGRRKSLMLGGAGQAVTMYIIGTIIKLVPPKVGGPIAAPSYVAIAAIFVYVSFYSFSFGPVVWVLTGELFPNHVRSFCVSLCVALQWLANYAIAKITPIMQANIGYGMFLFFGSCCAINVLFVAIFLPETKGVALESIGALFGDPTALPAKTEDQRESSEHGAETHDVMVAPTKNITDV